MRNWSCVWLFACWGEREGEIFIKNSTCVCHLWASPVVKDLPAKARDLGLIPESGRSPGEGNGNPLQYSCLENSMDRGVWFAMSMGSQRVGHDLVNKQWRCHLWNLTQSTRSESDLNSNLPLRSYVVFSKLLNLSYLDVHTCHVEVTVVPRSKAKMRCREKCNDAISIVNSLPAPWDLRCVWAPIPDWLCSETCTRGIPGWPVSSCLSFLCVSISTSCFLFCSVVTITLLPLISTKTKTETKVKIPLQKKKKIHEYDQFTENGWPHCTSQWMQNFEFVCWNSCPLNSHWLPSFGGPFLTLQLKGERLLLCLLSPSLPHSLLPPPPCSISSPFRSQLTSHLLREVIPDIIFMQLPLFFPTNQSLSPCFLSNTYFYGSHLVIY